MPDRFDVTVRVEINKRHDNGGWTGERLSVNQEFQVGTADFAQITSILARFSALADAIRDAHAE